MCKIIMSKYATLLSPNLIDRNYNILLKYSPDDFIQNSVGLFIYFRILFTEKGRDSNNSNLL